MQQNLTVIELRPFKGRWQCYEGEGVGLYWIGDTAKQSATDYVIAPGKFERGEFRERVFRLLRDNSKSGCSLFSESLSEKSFRHDNLPLLFGV